MDIHKKYITLLFIIFALTGCSKTIVRSDSVSNFDLSSLKSMYVVKLPADGRGMEKIIANKLNEFGFSAHYGPNSKPTEPVDAIVTYKDRWMWDITMYLLEIDIQLHNPESNFVFASGTSYRTSLVRKSPEYMIDEVFRDLFAGKIELPEKKKEEKEEQIGE